MAAKFYEIGKDAVRERRDGELFAFIVPQSERYGWLLGVLERGGVQVESPGAFTIKGIKYPQGTSVVRKNHASQGSAAFPLTL